jgi:hypothetical protein
MLKDLIEKIFRRQELADLKKEVKEKAAKIDLLLSGDLMYLDQHEKRMILAAIELPPFRARVELPATKAHVRIVWRDLREKLKMYIKKGGD